MSVESSFVGGNVACNAGGAKVVKYGPTATHVLGLEVVLPTGEVIEGGTKKRFERVQPSSVVYRVGRNTWHIHQDLPELDPCAGASGGAASTVQ
jgi:hypothetical protein